LNVEAASSGERNGTGDDFNAPYVVVGADVEAGSVETFVEGEAATIALTGAGAGAAARTARAVAVSDAARINQDRAIISKPSQG
jgi:hypothetical protein